GTGASVGRLVARATGMRRPAKPAPQSRDARRPCASVTGNRELENETFVGENPGPNIEQATILHLPGDENGVHAGGPRPPRRLPRPRHGGRAFHERPNLGPAPTRDASRVGFKIGSSRSCRGSRSRTGPRPTGSRG